MKLQDIRNLDFQNLGGWPLAAKVGLCVIVAAAVIGGGWYFFITEQQNTLEAVRAEEEPLKQDFERKQRKAANFEAYRAQLDQLNAMLRELIEQLPSKTQMPELINDIAKTAIDSGIENELFEPKAEEPRDFYAEQPIQLRMIGTYHQFGKFMSGVATLPRVVILTMHDIQLRPHTGGQAAATGAAVAPRGSAQLVLEGTIKTYRYLDASEMTGGQGATTSGGGQ
ncbi:MAG: fimbrial protein [Lysobacterales bacterium]|jgi:type IV pilus assembly protein PilO|nr:MAG: fimbrial protein [Xanthomonadales bacterium]